MRQDIPASGAGAQFLAQLARRIAPNGTLSEHFAIAQQMRAAILEELAKNPLPPPPNAPPPPAEGAMKSALEEARETSGALALLLATGLVAKVEELLPELQQINRLLDRVADDSARVDYVERTGHSVLCWNVGGVPDYGWTVDRSGGELGTDDDEELHSFGKGATWRDAVDDVREKKP